MNTKQIFDSMAYGPAPESAAEAEAWLAGRGAMAGHFIGGRFVTPRSDFQTRNPATGAVLAGVMQGTRDEVAEAVKAARKAQKGWAKDGHARARVLYAIARGLQKHARLLAVIETLDTGKPIRESRDIDVPLAIRHFYFHAGMAQLMDTELPGRAPLGVCGPLIPWTVPRLMLAWKLAPALAMGNTVVLKPAELTPLSAMVFCEIAQQAGVPPGVINIVTGDGETGRALVEAAVDKIAFTGSTEVGRQIREATAGQGKALTLELGGKSPYIIMDDADIDSAVEGLVDAIWFNQGQVCCAGSRLLVQEGIADTVYRKLKARMATLRVGDPLDKAIDIGAIIDPAQRDRIARLVDGNGDGEIYQTAAPEGCYYPPTLITGLSPSAALMQTEIFGPVLVATTFRTPAEAVEIANSTRYGLAASVWSENINVALDIAPRLAAGVVWINSTNMLDAAAGFGGLRESGFGREGGWEGLSAYTKPATKHVAQRPIPAFTGSGAATGRVDRTAKLYIGGKQARPDGGYSAPVHGPKGALIGHAGIANRKDLRNAVEAMNAAQGWAASSGHLRAQILYYIAENLSARFDEMAARLQALTGKPGDKEVQSSIETLFTFAAWADKYDGQVHDVPIRGVAMAIKEPVGKIAVFCADSQPLLGAITPMAAAMSMGNRITLIASAPFPLAATDLYQILDTSDVPPGVVNILTGPHADLAPHAGGHADIDAVWSFSGADIAAVIERAAAGNLKRTWVSAGPAHLHAAQDWLAAATEVRNIWIPFGS